MAMTMFLSEKQAMFFPCSCTLCPMRLWSAPLACPWPPCLPAGVELSFSVSVQGLSTSSFSGAVCAQLEGTVGTTLVCLAGPGHPETGDLEMWVALGAWGLWGGTREVGSRSWWGQEGSSSSELRRSWLGSESSRTVKFRSWVPES